MSLRSSILYNVPVLAGDGGPPGVVCVGVHHAPHHGGLHIWDQRALPQGSTRRLPLHLPCPRHPSGNHTAKTLYRKFETNIPRKGIALPQSQLTHSCVCERFIYYHDWSAYFAAASYMSQSWEHINRSQTRECGNWDWGRAIPFWKYINGISLAVLSNFSSTFS